MPGSCMASKITSQLTKPTEGRKRYSISFKRKPSQSQLTTPVSQGHPLGDTVEDTLRAQKKGTPLLELGVLVSRVCEKTWVCLVFMMFFLQSGLDRF